MILIDVEGDVAHHLEVLARLHRERVRVQPGEIGNVPALHINVCVCVCV